MEARLTEIEEQQQAQECLIVDLQMQGSKPKTAASTQEYKNWHVTLVELHVMLMVEDGAPFLQGMRSIPTYETSRRWKDKYAGKYLVAVGERLKDGSCMFVTAADTHWDWVDVEVLASYKDMKHFYGVKKNRVEKYDPEGGATMGTRTIPRLPLVPAHVGRNVIEGEMTAWKVVMLLKKMMNGATQELKNLINPALTWALQACCKIRNGGPTNGAPNDGDDEIQPRGGAPDANAGERDVGGVEGTCSSASATGSVTAGCDVDNRRLCGGTGHSGCNVEEQGSRLSTTRRLAGGTRGGIFQGGGRDSEKNCQGE